MTNLAKKQNFHLKSILYDTPYLLGLFILESDFNKIAAELHCPSSILKAQKLDIIQKNLSKKIEDALKKFSDKISTEFSMKIENCNGTCW